MLTPRHQALVATLAGMTVGVAVLVPLLVIKDNAGNKAEAGATATTAVSTPTPSAGLPNPLRADLVQYTRRAFGSDDDVTAEIPADWSYQPQSSYKYRYVADQDGTWMIRVNPRSAKQSPRHLAEDRQGSVRKAKDFKLVNLADGTKPVSWNPGGLTFTTLAFTFTRPEADATGTAGEARMQLSRWISVDGGKKSALEITVAGRPADEAGLQGVLDHATATLEFPRS